MYEVECIEIFTFKYTRIYINKDKTLGTMPGDSVVKVIKSRKG